MAYIANADVDCGYTHGERGCPAHAPIVIPRLPEPASGQVKIEIKAASVNPLGFDYQTQDFSTLNDIDVVLDSIGGETLARSWRVLNDTGIIVSLADFNIQDNGRKRGVFAFFRDAKPSMSLAMEMFEQNRLQVVMDAIYSLDETRAALEKVATSHARGKVTIRM